MSTKTTTNTSPAIQAEQLLYKFERVLFTHAAKKIDKLENEGWLLEHVIPDAEPSHMILGFKNNNFTVAGDLKVFG